MVYLLHKLGKAFLVIPLILLAFEVQKFSRKSRLITPHFVQEYSHIKTLRVPGLQTCSSLEAANEM